MAMSEVPAVFAPVVAAVKALNGGHAGSLYPGSPLLIAQHLRKTDRYAACELRPDDFDSLRRTLAPYTFAQAIKDDGYATAAARAGKGGRTFVLIDPPFERSDDYAQTVAATKAVLAKDKDAVIAAWMPLKDLETFDAFMRAMETVTNDALAAELRLRPLTDPMKMNGCAMVMVGAPKSTEGAIAEVTTWLADNLGDVGAKARIWRA
jgi:23S rRNA (adenine2030-N6)-methyltransferase